MGRKHPRKPTKGGTLTPALVVLLTLVGIFAAVLMTVALVRGTM